MTSFLDIAPQRRLAFCRIEGKAPAIVFLGGFRSDMTGTKALALQDWAMAEGRAFLRFDYSGHGRSTGRFAEGCIGDWRDDAAAMIAAQTTGPIVLVGSSMGGWIALLLARQMPERVAGLVGIAAAPDFTDRICEGLSATQQAILIRDGQIAAASDYGPEPHVYTRRLIEDGRRQRIFDRPLPLAFPTRLLQGSEDKAVPVAAAMRLFAHASGPDIRLTLIKGADHRLSTPDSLALIKETVDEVARIARRGAG